MRINHWEKQQIDDEVFGKDRLSTSNAPVVQNCCKIVGEKIVT